MTVLLRCTDPQGRAIMIEQDQWDNHITAHAEIVGHLDCVEKALTDPTFINRDKDFPSRENYYRPFTLPPPFDRTYLKVCVEFRRNGIRRMLVGEVVTAFSTGGVKQGETQLWP